MNICVRISSDHESVGSGPVFGITARANKSELYCSIEAFRLFVHTLNVDDDVLAGTLLSCRTCERLMCTSDCANTGLKKNVQI